MHLGSFKVWLEGNFGDGLNLLPSDAFDWSQTVSKPKLFFLMQQRWGIDKKQGRSFVNVDLPQVLNHYHYTSVHSNQMPGKGAWKHTTDQRPALTVDFHSKLGPMLPCTNGCPADGWTGGKELDKEKELNRLLGKFTPKYPEFPKTL